MKKCSNESKIILKYDGKRQMLELDENEQKEMDIFLERLYQEELAKAPAELKPTIHKFTSQEFADLMNRDEYNSWHKLNRHSCGFVKNMFSADETFAQINPVELLSNDGGILKVEDEFDTEIQRIKLFSVLPLKQAELLWAIHAEGISVAEIAKQEGVTTRAIYLRLKTAENSFKKNFPNPSLF